MKNIQWKCLIGLGIFFSCSDQVEVSSKRMSSSAEQSEDAKGEDSQSQDSQGAENNSEVSPSENTQNSKPIDQIQTDPNNETQNPSQPQVANLCPEAGNNGTLIGLPYPKVEALGIKGIAYAPGDAQNRIATIKNAGAQLAGYNIPWNVVEPNQDKAPCGGEDFQYDGYCYKDVIGNQIKQLNDAGMRVTAILYGVPPWARQQNTSCSPMNETFRMFCAPDNASDFARYAGMLAQVYNGQNGRGRIHNFVIHNEVNSNIWFDIGCGSGTSCDTKAWIARYADNYNKAYDKIKSHQSEARVLVSLEHAFGNALQDLKGQYPLIAGENFLKEFAPLVGTRHWQVAFHPYPSNLLKVEFSPLDWPKVTYGNPGQIIGWLRQNFPNDPHAWEVQFTESGINSSAPNSNEAIQATGVCQSTYNVLATPLVTDYIYHGMFDDGLMAELQVGLFRADGSAKPAWSQWSQQKDCGYENLPYTKLTQFKNSSKTWISTRLPPQGFSVEKHWFLLRQGNCKEHHILWECNKGNSGTFISRDPACKGAVNMGPVGYIHLKDFEQSISLFQCKKNNANVWFLSENAQCDGQQLVEFLGFARK